MAKTTAAATSSYPGSGPGKIVWWLKNRWERITSFLRDVRSEMRKVVAPSRKEVQATTVVVIATVFIFALYFGVIDSILSRALGLILH